MAKVKLTKADAASIGKSVELFKANKDRFEQLAKAIIGQLTIHPKLAPAIHFIKYRVKEPSHLRDKLKRKARERKEAILEGKKRIPIAINEKNLFQRVNDLAGIRLIHLHSKQFAAIHEAILEVFDEQKYELVEPPSAKCWDSEFEEIYQEVGLKTEKTAGYSSVHYVVRANTKTEITCELQVRTLTDEVWGEVSHRVNYPEDSPSDICREELRTLARFTTGCTRLVDSIFANDAQARGRTLS
jgi:putative GTP pyrophosphokinase